MQTTLFVSRIAIYHPAFRTDRYYLQTRLGHVRRSRKFNGSHETILDDRKNLCPQTTSRFSFEHSMSRPRLRIMSYERRPIFTDDFGRNHSIPRVSTEGTLSNVKDRTHEVTTRSQCSRSAVGAHQLPQSPQFSCYLPAKFVISSRSNF